MTRSTKNREQLRSSETTRSQTSGCESHPLAGQQMKDGGPVASMSLPLDATEGMESVLTSGCPEPTKVMVVSRISTPPHTMGLEQHSGETPKSRSSLAPLRSESAGPPPGSTGACRLGRSRATESPEEPAGDGCSVSLAPPPAQQQLTPPPPGTPLAREPQRTPARGARSAPGALPSSAWAVATSPGANGPPTGPEHDVQAMVFSPPYVPSGSPPRWLTLCFGANSVPMAGSSGPSADGPPVQGSYGAQAASSKLPPGPMSRSKGSSVPVVPVVARAGGADVSPQLDVPREAPGAPGSPPGAVATSSSPPGATRPPSGGMDACGVTPNFASVEEAAGASSPSSAAAKSPPDPSNTWPARGSAGPSRAPLATSSGFTLSPDGLRE